MGSSGRGLGWLVAPALVALAASALADPSPQQKELARDLMHKGYAARSGHDLKLALESFKGADDIMHVPTTRFEVARSQADLGLLLEAHETLVELQRMPEKSDESQAFREARGYAKVLDQQIVPRIPQLRISISGASSAAVSVDGTDLPDSALLVPYKVDPGHHVIVAKSGAAEGRAEVDVTETQAKDVWITLQAPSPAPVAAPSSPPATEPAAAEETPRHHGFGPAAWAGFGVAVAGIGVGAVTGIVTLNDKSSVATQCNGTRCPPSTYDKIDSANTMATISTVGFLVGGVGAVVGAAAWFFGWGVEPPSSPANGTGLRLAPAIGLGSIGLDGSF